MGNAGGGEKPEPFHESGEKYEPSSPRMMQSLEGSSLSPDSQKKSAARKARFAYVVSIKKCDFWSLSVTAGLGGPGVPEGSAFRWAALRAVKEPNPSALRERKSEPSMPRVTYPLEGSSFCQALRKQTPGWIF